MQLDGTLISPPMVEEIPTDAAGLAALRERVRRNPAVFGVLVSPDEKAALVRASFVETRLDYGALFKNLQLAKQQVEAEFPVEVYVTGQPLLFGWAYAFATEILLIFGLTLVVSVLLLWAYFRRFYGVFLPMSGAAVNVIWGLGFSAWVGYNLDPLVLVVPMLLTARAISHSVQFVERFYEEYEDARRQGRGVHPLDGRAAPARHARDPDRRLRPADDRARDDPARVEARAPVRVLGGLDPGDRDAAEPPADPVPARAARAHAPDLAVDRARARPSRRTR